MGKRERKKAYKDMIKQINNTSSGMNKSTFMADELAELKKQIKEEKDSKNMREVVVTTNVTIEEGYIYFLGVDLNLWRSKKDLSPERVVELVSDNEVAFGDGKEILDRLCYSGHPSEAPLHFIDEKGNVVRIPKPKSTNELKNLLLGLTKNEKLSLAAYQSDDLETYGSKEEMEYSNYIKFHVDNDVIQMEKIEAQEHEKYFDYTKAIKIYERIGLREEAARVRKLEAEQGAVKVDQTVVQGDQITKTEIKDSVLNRSNIGSGKSKAEEIKEIKDLLDSGAIDDDEFKQMKKEILGK